MIVAEYPDGDWQIVMQADHARMAGQLARAWRRPTFITPALWEQFILAADHHDDGWKLMDDDPLVNAQGKPVNFKDMPTRRHVATWQHTLDQALALGDYAHLLIASHARYLTTSIPSADEHARDAAVYLVEQLDASMSESLERLSRDPVTARAVDPRHFELTQKLFSTFDALSLVMVRGLDWISRTDPLPADEHVDAIKVHSETCSARWGRMTPWPFAEDDVTISGLVRRIPGRAYRDAADLHDTLQATPAKVLYWSMGRL